MAEAVLFANRFMKNEGAPSARDQMIVLLADGENSCGDVSDALSQLRASGVIFRHETVGFGIEPNSAASQDLQQIATASGGRIPSCRRRDPTRRSLHGVRQHVHAHRHVGDLRFG